MAFWCFGGKWEDLYQIYDVIELFHLAGKKDPM